MRKGRIVPKGEQARCDCEDERFKVAMRLVSYAADVGGGEEGEDVLDGLWQFPELCDVSNIHQIGCMSMRTLVQ